MDLPGKLVVRSHAPARRWLIAAIVLLLGGLALYVAFELGRFKAGYDAMLAASERDTLQRRIDAQEKSTREIRVKLAAAEEARIADVRERDEVARTIGELQAQVEHQEQDIEFYRGLSAQPGQKDPVMLGVQQFHITAAGASQTYSLRFSINRLQRPGEAINGVIRITIDGNRNGAHASVDLAALSDGKRELPFSVRYTTALEQPVTLPADFQPLRVTLELRPDRKDMGPYRQTFVWSVDPG
jgi:hypothetical protein